MPEDRQEQLLSLNYGTTTLLYTLERYERKTLAVEVHPDLRINVKAPANASLADIEKLVGKKAKWIVRQQAFFEQFLPRTPTRQYVAGETHLYLGRRYVLKIKEATQASVKLTGGNFWVYTDQDKSDNQYVRQLMGIWYRQHAERIFRHRLKTVLPLFGRYRLPEPPLIIRRMDKRWGSYTPTGRILLNPELIKVPVKCIDYVLVHELCHTVFPHHGSPFYQLQEELNPRWSYWKKRLEQVTIA